MVEANPNNAEAYVRSARFRYEIANDTANLYRPELTRFDPDAQIDSIAVDTAKALELDPDNLDALLLAASHQIRKQPRGDYDLARRLLDHAVKIQPAHAISYLFRAELEHDRLKLSAAAEDALKLGLKQVPKDAPGYPDLSWAMALVLLESNQTSKADAYITKVLEPSSILARPLIDYLKARLAMLEDNPTNAINQLVEVRPFLTKAEWKTVAALADMDLARCYEIRKWCRRSRQPDRCPPAHRPARPQPHRSQDRTRKSRRLRQQRLHRQKKQRRSRRRQRPPIP